MKPNQKDLSLFGIIKEGIKAVPQVKYALGIAAISAVVMMVVTFSFDLRVAVWGTLILLALMFVLVIFVKLSLTSSKEFRKPVIVLIWFFAALFMSVCLALTSSVFFKFPIDLQYWLRPATAATVQPAATPVLARADTGYDQSIGVNYMRLFGAMEVPYMMSLFNYPTRTFVKATDGFVLEGLESSDVGFLFVILTNNVPVEVFNLSFDYRLYVNSFPITNEDIPHWKTKADPDGAGLREDSLVHMAGQKEVLRLASLKPNASVLWLLGIYKKNADGLPKAYLSDVMVPEKVTFMLNNKLCQDSIRRPYGLQAAKVAIPYGWFSQ